MVEDYAEYAGMSNLSVAGFQFKLTATNPTNPSATQFGLFRWSFLIDEHLFNVGPFSGIAFLKFGMMKFWSLWLEKQETGSQVASRKKGPKWLYKNRPFFLGGGLGGSPNFGTSQVTNIYAYISDGDSTYTTGIRAQWNTVFGTVQVPGSGQTYWEVEVTSLGLLPEFPNALYCLYHFTSFYICLYQFTCIHVNIYILVFHHLHFEMQSKCQHSSKK